LLAPGEVIDETTRAGLSSQFQGTASASAGAASSAASHFDGSLFQIVLSLVPDNITAAMSDNKSLLHVIVFAVFFGAGLTLIEPEKARPVAGVMDGINEAMIKLIEMMMKLAPYGVFALVFMVAVRAGPEILLALGYYT